MSFLFCTAMKRLSAVGLLVLAVALPYAAAAEAGVVINRPMAPPAWAFLERALLRYNSEACEWFASKYLDERGYLLHTPRWGTLDGPDDAIETFFNWTLLHALGGSDSVLELYRKAQEGHWRQYNELRTKLTDLAANGAYYKEFITMSDWFHTGEGMRAFMLYGLSQPNDPKYRERMTRFAGLYMNEDPEAPNYDPVNRVIRSIWNGSKGPMMRKATVYDWVGDPVPGRFHLLHSANRNEMQDLEKAYPKMLAHCNEYLDSVGDNSLNLAATMLAINAYMLTGEAKYRNWVLEYVNAWRERTQQTGGNIPSTVGLDGKPGSLYNGQWWKGTYGWNFTIFDGEIEQIAHRNYFTVGPWTGFSNALLLTGDQSYIGVLRRQMDNIYAQKKIENGQTLLPQMYGDPRGYKYDGPPSWYHYTTNLFTDRLTEIYMWSMERKDLERIPITGWIAFLEGKDPDYPSRTLQAEISRVQQKLAFLRADKTTADTRLADYLLQYNPPETNGLMNLMLGGYIASSSRQWTLHSRFRYFDPARRRAGVPEDVAALVEKLSADSATLTLVNLNPVHPREVIVQAGAFGEHSFESVTVGERTTPIGGPLLTVRLEPGCGARLEFRMARYVNQPTLAHPWDRAWFGKR